MCDDRDPTPPDRDEALLERLRALVEERDPVPERVLEAARSALAAGAHVAGKPHSEGSQGVATPDSTGSGATSPARRTRG